MEIGKRAFIANVVLFSSITVFATPLANAQENKIDETCYIASCPGHLIPTHRDEAAKVKLTNKQCKLENECQKVLNNVELLKVDPQSCSPEAVNDLYSQIEAIEKKVKDLGKKTKAEVFNSDGRPTIAHLLEAELAERLSACEAVGLFPRWSKECITKGCIDTVSEIDSLPLNKVTCEDYGDSTYPWLHLKSENFIVQSHLESFREKCCLNDYIPVTNIKGKDYYYSELADRKSEFDQKLQALSTPRKSFFNRKGTVVSSVPFEELIDKVDALQIDQEQCSSGFIKTLRNSIKVHQKIFKKYPELSRAMTLQADRGLEKIQFHASECKKAGLK